MACKIIFCSEFPDIPDKVGRNKKKRNTGNCKSFCVLGKRKKWLRRHLQHFTNFADISFRHHILFDAFLLTLGTSSRGFIYLTGIKQVGITISNNQMTNFDFESVFS